MEASGAATRRYVLRVCDPDYLYDIAASLLPLREKSGFAAMREAFLRGYRRIRPLAAEHAELLETFFIARGIFSVRLMTGKLWDLPRIREYAETAVPQIVGGIRIFLERRHGSGQSAGGTRTRVQFCRCCGAGTSSSGPREKSSATARRRAL